MIGACIFDLDGVIVDTAKYHFIAWRKLANELGFDFSEDENEKLKGISRMDSLNLILQWGGIELNEETKVDLATKKNEWYRSYILKMQNEEILEGVLPFLTQLKSKGLRLGIGSSSKNATTILQQIEIDSWFDVIIDGTKLTKSKPDPQVFLLGASALKINPNECIVFEDAAKGVDAALAGGFYTVGIGKEEVLGHAHLVLPNFKNVQFESILNRLKQL